jgi:hypothetical protein
MMSLLLALLTGSLGGPGNDPKGPTPDGGPGNQPQG